MVIARRTSLDSVFNVSDDKRHQKQELFHGVSKGPCNQGEATSCWQFSLAEKLCKGDVYLGLNSIEMDNFHYSYFFSTKIENWNQGVRILRSVMN